MYNVLSERQRLLSPGTYGAVYRMFGFSRGLSVLQLRICYNDRLACCVKPVSISIEEVLSMEAMT